MVRRVDAHFGSCRVGIVVSAATFALVLCSITPLGGMLPAGQTASVAASSSARWCWCTDYIKNRFNLPRTADAKDMGPILTQAKFRRLASNETPHAGDVVIISPSFFPKSYGAPAVAGHISVVVSAKASGNNWGLTLHGANQTGQMSVENGCTDVSTTGYSSKDRSYFAFYRR